MASVPSVNDKTSHKNGRQGRQPQQGGENQMIEKIHFADPDHESIHVNEKGEEVCPECEQVPDECTCRSRYVDEPDLPEKEET